MKESKVLKKCRKKGKKWLKKKNYIERKILKKNLKIRKKKIERERDKKN